MNLFEQADKRVRHGYRSAEDLLYLLEKESGLLLSEAGELNSWLDGTPIAPTEDLMIEAAELRTEISRVRRAIETFGVKWGAL